MANYKQPVKTFLLKDLEKFSGIKAHTLRTWETRYAVLCPKRTPGNNRIYTVYDLEKILNFSVLNKKGLRIANLAAMSALEITRQLQLMQDDVFRKQKSVNDLILYMYHLDLDGFDNKLEWSFANWQVDDVFADIIYPFLYKTGLLWRGNRLTEEHFVVTCLKNKLIAAIEGMKTPENFKHKVLLFLPGKGQFDLAMHYVHYILKARGVKVISMGHDVSIANLAIAINSQKPDYILTHVSKHHKKDGLAIFEFMENVKFPTKLIVITEQGEEALKVIPSNVLMMDHANAMSFICN